MRAASSRSAVHCSQSELKMLFMMIQTPFSVHCWLQYNKQHWPGPCQWGACYRQSNILEKVISVPASYLALAIASGKL